MVFRIYIWNMDHIYTYIYMVHMVHILHMYILNTTFIYIYIWCMVQSLFEQNEQMSKMTEEHN